MTRTLVIIALLAVGCGRSTPTPAKPEKSGQDALINYARTQAPVIDRTLYQADLKNIHLLLQTIRTESADNRWPKSLDEVKPAFQRDARKQLQLIEAGDIVVRWGLTTEGVLAYTKDAGTKGGSVVMTNGDVQYVSAEEFRKLVPQR